MDFPARPARWDRGRWVTVFSSHSPTIREVTECLGLALSPSASTTNRGIPKFDSAEFKKVASEVTRLSKELPQDREALLDYASNPNALEKELDEVLESLGPQIWGKDADRSHLVTPDASKKTYYKHLYYEDPEDRDCLKIHLQRWIVIKACYYIRNRKLKKQPGAGVDDYEILTDLDATSPPQKTDLLSPSATPTSSDALSIKLEPSASCTEAGAQQPIKPQKRKSSSFISVSDEEDASVSLSGARKRSQQSLTFPVPRKSPRKPIVSRLSTENLTPRHDVIACGPDTRIVSPSPTHQLQPPVHPNGSASPTPGSGRSLLSPLSINTPNGATISTNAPPSSSAYPSPKTFTPTTAASPSNFAVVSTPVSSATAPSSAFAPINAQGHSSEHATPTFAAVNAPVGFTPINTASSSNVPVAPNSSLARSHSIGEQGRLDVQQDRPDVQQDRPDVQQGRPDVQQGRLDVQQGRLDVQQGQPDAQQARPDVHMTKVYSEPTFHRFPAPQRDLSPHRQPNIQNHHISSPLVIPAPEPRHTMHTLAPNGPLPQQSQQVFHTHSIPPTNGAQQHIQPKPHPYALPNGVNLASTPILPSNNPNRAPMTSHIPEQQHRPIARAVSPPDITLLQCELLPLLIRYFFPRDQPRLDENILLQNLDYIWLRNDVTFRRLLGAAHELHTRILYAWMEERQKIHQLQHVMEGQPGVRASEMVDRLLAMNDLRVMRLKWKAMKTQDGNHNPLSPEDLLCRTFAMMTKTEGTEHLFKDGLERINESVFEFLRSEDMKISMSKR